MFENVRNQTRYNWQNTGGGFTISGRLDDLSHYN
jgi:hypothetical protein